MYYPSKINGLSIASLEIISCGFLSRTANNKDERTKGSRRLSSSILLSNHPIGMTAKSVAARKAIFLLYLSSAILFSNAEYKKTVSIF